MANLRAAKRNSFGRRTACECPLWNTLVVFMGYAVYLEAAQRQFLRQPRDRAGALPAAA
jgi:hypothetical protein